MRAALSVAPGAADQLEVREIDPPVPEPGEVIVAVEAVGLNGDMLEAQAFAHLAVRVARGLPTSCPGTTGVAAAVGGGRISRPAR